MAYWTRPRIGCSKEAIGVLCLFLIWRKRLSEHLFNIWGSLSFRSAAIDHHALKAPPLISNNFTLPRNDKETISESTVLHFLFPEPPVPDQAIPLFSMAYVVIREFGAACELAEGSIAVPIILTDLRSRKKLINFNMLQFGIKYAVIIFFYQACWMRLGLD